MTTDFLSEENMRNNVFAECSMYLTTMVSVVVGNSKKATSGEYKLDVDELFRLFHGRPQTAETTLSRNTRNIFMFLSCFSFSNYYDLAHLATQGIDIHPDNFKVAINRRDVPKQLKQVLNKRDCFSMLSTYDKDIAFLSRYGILDDFKENASEFFPNATGFIQCVQVSSEFITFFHKYIMDLQNGGHREDKQVEGT